MRIEMQILILVLTLSQTCVLKKPNPGIATLSSSGPRKPATDSSANGASKPRTIDFAKQIRPILESKCQPCHFAGGTMYQRLPFDRPATIYALGTKLFTRIKDENDRRLIRQFLSEQ